MEEKDILSVFEETKALLQGHFLLTSGAHSPTYFQCARVLQHPQHTSTLCSALIKKIGLMDVDTVISPAIGGIVVGQEMGRLLDKKTIFAEREDGKMTLRRGFSVAEGEKVLVVEDVVTTGGSVKEVIELVKEEGAEVIGVAVIVDRSNGQADFGLPFYPLVQLEVVKYEADSCPLCKEEMALVKPGSRKVF